MSGPIAFTSLNAATATGAGGYPALNMPRSIHAMQVSFTGAPTRVAVTLEGTIDGTNWKTFQTFDTAIGNVSGDIVVMDEIPLLNVRANLTVLTGGATPTVTAAIMQDSYN